MRRASLANETSRYCVLDVSLAPQLAAKLGLSLDQAAAVVEVKKWLGTMLNATNTAVTGVLADPVYSWPVLSPLKTKAGTVLMLQTQHLDVDPMALPQLLPDWNVEAVAQNYAMAGLEMWYHPVEQEALTKKQFVAEIADYCHHEGIDLLLRLRFYNYQDATSSTLADQLLQAVQELRASCQLLVLDFPLDSLTAATMTAELDIPWLVYLGDQTYAQAKDTLRQALESGAAGCVMGDALWSDLLSLPSPTGATVPAATPSKIATELGDRAVELARIVTEHAQTTQGSLTWTPT